MKELHIFLSLDTTTVILFSRILKFRKKTMTSQFADMASSPIFFDVFFGFFAKFLSVQVLCQYHDWFWSYNNFCL